MKTNAAVCPECGGTGTVERERTRRVYRYGQEFQEDVPMLVECEACDGTGVEAEGRGA